MVNEPDGSITILFTPYEGCVGLHVSAVRTTPTAAFDVLEAVRQPAIVYV